MVDYILIRGSIGVGKTTIATLLEKKISEENYHAKLWSLDKFKNENVSKDVTYYAKRRAIELLTPIVNSSIDKNNVPLIEGVLYEQDLFLYLINNVYGKALKVKLTAPLELCIKRDSIRAYPRGVYRVTRTWNLLQNVHGDDYEVNAGNKNIEEIVNEIIDKFKHF